MKGLITKTTIDCLVSAGVLLGPKLPAKGGLDPLDPHQVGSRLAQDLVNAFRCDESYDWYADIAWRPWLRREITYKWELRVDNPWQVLKSCDAFETCCEACGAWFTSPVRNWVGELRRAALTVLGFKGDAAPYQKFKQYEAALWAL